jgi:hypothetical protein
MMGIKNYVGIEFSQLAATDSHILKYFLIALAAFFIGEYFWKKKLAKQ